MDWERIKERLEAVLQTPMHISLISETDWTHLSEEQAEQPVSFCRSIERGQDVLFYLAKEHKDIRVLQVTGAKLTASERKLIEMSVESKQVQEKKQWGAFLSEDERKAYQLRDWLLEQMERGSTYAELPDALASQSSLYSTKIPLLLYGDYSQNQSVSYADLKKLLESFFESEIILIPLMDKEWLILAPEGLLTSGSEEREGDEEESVEQILDALGSGLYEMLANEWVGECHLAIDYPVKPAKSLFATILKLRETIMLGRSFHVGSFIHLRWELRLEKLLHLIEEEEKAEFLEQVLRGTDHALDAETVTTLEHFFTLDCNVSETAKKLYIHRNTLLYRLDKFKNETGLDVRTFNHAVLVRLALLLYKVTKRK
ncbi:PucR family transcriptional regulator [Paenibacillus aceris]|uniref:Sugar diacid utilization regulator n=1 Tax=Paenibacillus aceris TaxID=869555 RepID=A0ABS4I2B4_9BACL|nr:helix-turn-helix domain-containing protein [Paenibacillus aceris]MBP1964865.1 sugar diacid utilization regulator [Paenibacillus aceris]NHW33841.1 PucR family transcriptional regulator [Paenibacillus aceris]